MRLFAVFLLVLSIIYNSNGDMSTKSKCKICRSFVDGLNILWSTDITKDCVAELAATVCTYLKIENERICKLIISQFKDEVTYVIAKVILQPNQICGLFINDCGTPYNFLQSNWSIKIPNNKPPLIEIIQPKTPVSTLRILQLTDIHFDPYYKVGAEAECDTPQCCRIITKHKAKLPAGKWGTVAKCDIPIWTVEELFKKLSKSEKFDLIFWTGDLAPHDDWNYSKNRTTSMLKYLTELFLTYFPHTPVISAVGNHEGVPVDSFSPHYIPQEYTNDWLYDMLAKQWTNWLPNTTIPSIRW